MTIPTQPLNDATQDLAGEVLDDRYRLIEGMKRGAMGTVYLAEQLRLGTIVAVKVLHDTQDERARERFAREAAALGQLQHPNIARGIDFGWTKDGQLYLVMDRIQGVDLRERLAGGPAVQWREACSLGAQIAGALHAAHVAGLVHRDLKPENVMLDREAEAGEEVRVLDFGIAKAAPDALGGSGRPLTLQGDVIGTVGYMAPEQAMGQIIDRRADLYSLGVLLWEMLSGKRLFREEAETVLGIQLEDDPRPPKLPSDAPAELGALVVRLLRTLPDARPSNAAEVEVALAGFLETPATRRVPYGWIAAVATLTIVAAGGIWAALNAAPAPIPELARAAPVAPAEPRFTVVAPEALPEKEEEVEEEALPLDALLEGRRAERVAAAHAVLARAEEAPPFAIAVARLELARECETKHRQIRALSRYADSRARPALQRANRLPTDGCGAFNRRDCFSCLRDDLARALRTLPR